MQTTWIDKFTRSFFWFGFCVFLAASIPHIAAYYRHFDPNAVGIEDVTNWSIGYLIAIVIDVTDVLVSIAVLKALNSGTRHGKLIGYWSFIVFVTALSWFVNWQYNIVYQTLAFARADSQHILGVSVGLINPIIGSAFQLLLLIYTAMAHKFSDKPVMKTAEQLKAEADEMEQIAAQQVRIDRLRDAQKTSQWDSFFDGLGHAKERAKELLSDAQIPPTEPSQSEQPPSQSEPSNDPEIPVERSQMKLRVVRKKTVLEPEERVRRVLRENPDVSIRELAKLATVAQGTAKKYKQMLSQSEVMNA